MAAVRILTIALILSILGCFAESNSDTNHVFSPCSDATVQQSDGFSFGIAFAKRTSFFYNNSLQLPPCDRRLSLSLSLSLRPTLSSLSSARRSMRSLFSLSTLLTSPRDLILGPVCFHQRKKSRKGFLWWVYGGICWSEICCEVPPAFVANSTYTVTSFTLVLEFKKGRLQNLYWKRDGCASCSGREDVRPYSIEVIRQVIVFCTTCASNILWWQPHVTPFTRASNVLVTSHCIHEPLVMHQGFHQCWNGSPYISTTASRWPCLMHCRWLRRRSSSSWWKRRTLPIECSVSSPKLLQHISCEHIEAIQLPYVKLIQVLCQHSFCNFSRWPNRWIIFPWTVNDGSHVQIA
ncbi:hypothetical protein F0562_017072 [Nyssa sinensis]|uniref:Uncharacterized protein n=1 Tax=Nyssa sinensis TaxID=561372 RepID=A0A5J4ZHT9_9ASTE|nr:hypothetical protein F0562_017072 [Nyssa sinensis]